MTSLNFKKTKSLKKAIEIKENQDGFTVEILKKGNWFFIPASRFMQVEMEKNGYEMVIGE